MQNTPVIPIEKPTNPYIPPGTGGDGTVILGTDPTIWFIIAGVIIAIVLFFYIRRWAKAQTKKTLDEVNPALSDLDSTAFSLTTYLAIQGGLAIIISVICTLSIVFILTQPILTILTCAASIGLSGYGREKGMNFYRSGYKNRQNLEGYMRTKRGDKRRYSWANIKFQNPYTPDENQYQKLLVQVSKVNALALEEGTKGRKEILTQHGKIEELRKKIQKIDYLEIHGEEIEDVTPKEGQEVVTHKFFTVEEIEEKRAPILKEIREKERGLIELGAKIPKEIDLDILTPNPILINGKYLVVIISRGNLKNNVDFVDWYDYDIFGEFEVPCAGPELRELTTFHRVKVNPEDEKFRMDEYVPVFASIFDDSHARDALRPLEAIDLETNDIIAAMAKAMGVERKHTAGEINTSKALTGDLLNEDRDFELLVKCQSAAKANKIIDAEKKLKSLDRILDYVTPPVVVLVVIFVVGCIIGYLLGQNSVLIG